MRLLIVEDDPNTSELINLYLAPFSSRIHYAASLEDCFRFCESPVNDFDLIILDLQLPDSVPTNTADAITEIKDVQKNAALLVITGMGPTDYFRNLCIDRGADGFLAKDSKFGKNALYAAVFAVISSLPVEGRTDTFLKSVEFFKNLAES